MNHFLKRILAWCLALSLLTVGGFAAAGESENSDADQHSPSETTLTAEEITAHFVEAADFYDSFFMAQDVYRDDVITTRDNTKYFRVKQADSLEAFRDYCRQYYSEEIVKWMTAGYGDEWIEQDGKLYVKEILGVGGPSVSSLDFRIWKDTDTRYTVVAHEKWYDESGNVDQIYHLCLNNGNWQWDTVPNCNQIDSVVMEEERDLPCQYRIERIDRSGTETKNGVTLTVLNYYDLVTLTPADSPAAEKINQALTAEMEKHFDQVQSFIDQHYRSGSLDLNELTKKVSCEMVTINEDFFSICQKEIYQLNHYSEQDYIWNHGYVFDLKTGEQITLPAFLGLDSAKTKAIVEQAIREHNYAGKPGYTTIEPDQYSFYVDHEGQIHVTFGENETDVRMTWDLILDYHPEPQLISQPEPTLVESESAVCLSAHVYGTDLSYEWEYSDDEGATWVPADCADPVLEIDKENAVKERLYRCAVFNDAGRVVTEPIAIPTEVLSALGTTSGAGLLGDSRNLILIAACAAVLLLLLALLFVLRRRRREKQGEDLTVTAAQKPPEPSDASVADGPKFCGRCGAPRTGTEAFCARCGRPFRNRTGE